MVRIRLRRIGMRGRPYYRIVVADQRKGRSGGIIEQIGTYDSFPTPPAVTLDDDKAAAWISKGAQASDTVAYILKQRGVYDKVKAGA
jgi:small subunit ribosomal protein S16